KLEITPQQVLKNKGPKISNVSIVVDCRTARVETDYPWFGRAKLLPGVRQSIVDAQHDSSNNRVDTRQLTTPYFPSQGDGNRTMVRRRMRSGPARIRYSSTLPLGLERAQDAQQAQLSLGPLD